MGKFFEAIKKSEATIAGGATRAKLPPQKIADITPNSIDSLRLDTKLTELTHELEAFQASMDERLVSFIYPNSMAGECFKMLRAKILTKNSGTRPRSVMVTSPQPLDGKTTVSANLAINIARGINEFVVLVDCDLRRPSMAHLLGLNAADGLREYLEKGISVAPYLTKTSIEKLTLLQAGRPPVNPSELLSSEKMRDLVRELETRYEDRYIIFDASPAQFGAETTFLASMVDGVLLVVRFGKTSKDQVLESINNIGRDKVLGIVFNASQECPKDHNYYYRYYKKNS